jgi:hypothetical protein
MIEAEPGNGAQAKAADPLIGGFCDLGNEVRLSGG